MKTKAEQGTEQNGARNSPTTEQTATLVAEHRRTSSITPFTCPGCGHTIEAHRSAQAWHECPRRRNRLTQYQQETA